MPLLREDKKQLAQQYTSSVEEANNTVVLSYKGIPVNEMNAVRMDIVDAKWKLQAVKKRVLLKSVAWKLEWLSFEGVDDSIMLLYSHNEEDKNAPLKVINKHAKLWTKGKKEFGFDYIGGWYDKVRQSADYVKELANLPSREELLGKFVFLLNYPVSSFARVIQAIADKGGEEVEKKEEEVVEEKKDEESKVDDGDVNNNKEAE